MSTTHVGVPRQAGVDEWRALTLRADDALSVLAAEWEQLYQRCGSATPFQTHAWLESWWRGYGRPGHLVVIAVRHQGRLVAAGAFQRVRRLGIPVVVPIGERISDFTDILVDDEYRAGRAIDLFAAELARAAGRCVVD